MNKKIVEVIQINMGKNRYFCKNSQEQEIFDENHPGAKTESFTIELPDYIAKKYLDNPDNKKQFERKKNAG